MNFGSGAAPVIWKSLVKHQTVPVRAFVLALILLISATPLGWAAVPAGAAIVLQLQLPPSTSPEAVKGLIADLAAKGALPVTQPTEPPEATPAYDHCCEPCRTSLERKQA